ncbi:saccharopine dehydrogenase NADP-binding domain-containing protein [Saccharomonospora sp. CUA-673]|uniref:saccharopine dehydrogenase NADP-binding domain-containing protein n=1 Tax=Saccharomonospora sp. CUA-673 TaxID=1904969 RepID=UPI003515782D
METSTVDLSDAGSLAAFCAGADVVLNCAGPSYRVLDTVARAALEAGAAYVDVAGDVPAHRALGESSGIAVFSAGAMPGLTGLLPRLVTTSGVEVEVHVGGAVPIPPTSAADILLARGPDFGEPGALWRDGVVARHALPPRRRVTVPGFPGTVDAMPFLPVEGIRLAEELRPARLTFRSVYVSEAIPTALAMAWADDPEFLAEHTAALTAAAEADLRTHEAFYVLTARAGDAAVTLRAADPYRLSGVVAALVVRAVLDENVEHGTHFADQVLDARTTAEALRRDPLVDTVTFEGIP